LWSLPPTGLKTGHYGGSLIRGLFAPQIRLERRRRGLFGGGREEVVLVVLDGIADGLSPVVGAEGVGVFVLGEVDGLHESLGQVGDGAGGSGLYIAAEDGGDEASQGGAEIAGGEIVAREELGKVFAE
jgi:hypothetical protein